jgi:hypothetical protein
MENYLKTDKQQHEAIHQLNDTLNDEHWEKKYGVSADELKDKAEIGLMAKIIQANSKNKARAV